jgi:hypothetical protein
MRKHIDTLIIIGSVLTACLWINTRFNAMEKDITIIKTVLIMRGILPTELATNTQEKK